MDRLAAFVTLSSGTKRFLIALFAGALAAFALPPFGIFVVGFVSFSILVWLLDGAAGNPDRNFLVRLLPAFLIGWAFGLGYFVTGLWWIGNALLVEAESFAWALPLAILGLPAYLALFYGLAAALARLFWTDGFARLLGLGAAFGLAEWLRGFLFSGFPWNSIGQAVMPFPAMMQSIAIVGSDTMNVIAVVVFAAPGLIAAGRGARPALALACVLLAMHVGFGLYQLQQPATYPENARVVRLVQPVIDQAAKIDDNERSRIFAEHLALTKAPAKGGGKRPDYIVWPETSIPFILTQNPDALVQIADTLEDGQVLIAGAVRMESDSAGQEPRYYNSIYVIDSQGQIISAADKVHLVPFGEYLPFEDLLERTGWSAVAAMPGGFSAAQSRQNLTLPDGLRLLPLICYEIIFPNEISSESQADAIVNLTNDGWFGYSPGPWQHFFQARLRAVETGLPVIRNSNSGISAVIDGRGRILSGLDFQAVGYIDETLPSKIAVKLNEQIRSLNFGLLEFTIFVIVLITRMSFIFKRN
ncbi:apolipoprotein N-acyltransferase [Rhizobium sp. KVB221]|uniref:Apolipoprotein N-acyltransferase n=1 Tax=Rhizobium setariae TaxID=2801340 RepID=A0A936YLN1_9HYPH|nr:apolipoprotein N-acyltransferase [Rhizobium setariae]MBL0370444.1 apolipoprotein N-acyltransferase [Rhizobium setariae]